jgi:predicted XRE-type DNA-binding protein
MTVIGPAPRADEPVILASGQSNDSFSFGDLPRKVEDTPHSKGAIGKRIKQASLQAGLQQFEVARRCGVSRAAVSELGEWAGHQEPKAH